MLGNQGRVVVGRAPRDLVDRRRLVQFVNLRDAVVAHTDGGGQYLVAGLDQAPPQDRRESGRRRPVDQPEVHVPRVEGFEAGLQGLALATVPVRRQLGG